MQSTSSQGKEGKNYKNFNISRMKRAFRIKQKASFIVFEELSFGEKNRK